MSTIPFIIVLVLLGIIKTNLKAVPHPLKWDQWIKAATTADIFLVIAETATRADRLINWTLLIFLGAIIWIVYQREELKSMRALSFTILPYIGISVIKNLVNLFSFDALHTWNGFLQTAQLLAIIWIFATWFTANRQQKALEKEREQRKKDDELNKAIAARKVELEVMVKERTAELMQQKDELQHALADLRTTQDQLIQSEKLASLGELTAGIAHEIQNPLNFVNNFSEVSIELVDEMETELQNGDKDEAIAIATDIRQNLEKIIHHGKRADGIVKGMLQHSRNNSGERQPTDINVLADEYFRLSYHGLRAKDKSFNAMLTTHYQENIPKTSIVPQDIGRVLLNLFNNAFYAVNQKQKSAGADYKPEVMVSTSFNGTFLVIRVKDNGTGIPEEIQEKILQPFFTTKPTGEGTGLGLSLSYDIVVKGHGGSFEIESKEGEGSEFLINLPVRD